MKNNQAQTNTIEFSETRTGRSFKASFTDTVGHSISEAFGIIIANKMPPKKSTQIGLAESSTVNGIEVSEAEVVEEQTVHSSEIEKLKKIFKIDGDKATLNETRLKAKSKRDYAIRLAVIFLYYKSLLGQDTVPRRELTAIVDNASVEDGNFRFWLANNPMIGINGDGVEIKAPGKDAAKKYITEIFNPDLKDKWQIGTQSKVGRKPKEKKANEKSK